MSRPAFPYRMLTISAFLILGAVLAGYAQPGNLLPNPGFEQVNPDTQYPEYWGKHWAYKGLWLVKQDASFAHRGSVCLGVHQAGPEAHKAFTGLPGKRLEVRGSRSYHTSAWVKGHGDLWFSVYLNSTSAFLGSIASDGFHVDSDEWRLVSWDFTIPERKELKGRERPVERLTVAYHVKGGPVWLDDVALYVQGEQPEEEDEPSYYSGERVPLLTIPRTDEAIDVDGEIEDAGWSRAAGVTGFLLLGGGLSPRQTEVLAVRDDANLYVAFSGAHEGPFRRDGGGARDEGFSSQVDSVEVWLQPPGQTWKQIVILASGAVLDQDENRGFEWDALGLQVGSIAEDTGQMAGGIQTFARTRWTVEMAIPFEDLGTGPPEDGTVWRMNFCRDYSVAKGRNRTPGDWATWSPLRASFTSPREFGNAVFRGDAPGVKVSTLGDLRDGIVSVGGAICAGKGAEVGAEARVVLEGQDARTVLVRRVKEQLEAGERSPFALEDAIKVERATDLRLQLAAKDLGTGETLTEQSIPFRCMASFRLTLMPLLVRGYMDVEADAGNVPGLPESATARVRLMKPGDPRVLGEAHARLGQDDARATLRLDLSSLEPGQYMVNGALLGDGEELLASSAEPVTVPGDIEWLGNDLGKTDGAPPPWEPVEVEGATVRVTQREYVLSDSGLPNQISILGGPVLTRPAALRAVVNGQPVEWTFDALKRGTRKPGWVDWRIRGRGGALSLNGSLRIEYDGFALWNVELDASTPVTLDELALVFPLRSDFALHARGPGAANLQREPGDSPPDIVTVSGYQPYSPAGWRWPNEFKHQLWAGDDRRGLALMCETDENIHGPKYCDFVTRGDERTMEVSLISEPLRLEGPLAYEYAYQATPVKPEPTDPRLWRAAYGGSITSLASRGYADFLETAYVLQQYWIMKWLCYPEIKSPGAWGQIKRIRDQYGFKTVSNYHYNAIAKESPVYPHFKYEWEVLPRSGWSAPTGTAGLCCLRTSWQDFALHTVGKFVDEFGFDGIYTDSGATLCTNPIHGCGYERDGVRQPTLNLWATRETMKRIHAMLNSEGRDGLIFSHTIQAPCIVGFADVITQGEEWCRTKERQYRDLTPGMFRTREARTQYGTPFTWYTFHQYGWRAKAYGTPVPFDDVLGMTLLHRVLPTPGDGVGNAAIPEVWEIVEPWWTASEFIPYWAADAPVSTGSEDVLASTFLKRGENRALVVVFNWAYEERAARLSVGGDALPGQLRLTLPREEGRELRGGLPPELQLGPRELKILLLEGG